jgi:glycosyltransferase involved in cell wall biosynthesis
MGGYGQKMARKLKIPTVHTYHTMMTEYTHYVPVKFLRGMARKFIIFRSKRFCNRANRVIVPSSPMIDVLKSYGVKTKIEVLPTGIDLKQYKKLSSDERRTILKKYKIPSDKKILLYVGRLAQEKNLDFLLESFKDILIQYPNSHLVFVGSGPYQQKIKNQISKIKIDQNVTLTGFLPKPETNQFFGASDIFVFPSTTDTQGIVLAEAMASSCPAVAINQLGPKDIIKNGEDGFLVSLNQKEFTDKILRLLKDEKLRKKFSQKAKENVKRFSIENCTDKLIQIYEKTIHEYTNNTNYTNLKSQKQSTNTRIRDIREISVLVG